MGRAPCCSKVGLHRGPWTPREDALLTKYIQAHGEGQWRSLPKRAGLLRCGKSCRLRWMNYLRPDIKRGNITPEEDDLIIRMHSLLGNRWSLIAGRLPGRTDNEIKNYWNTHLSKKLTSQGTDPNTHKKLLIKDPLQQLANNKKSTKRSNKKKICNNKPRKNDVEVNRDTNIETETETIEKSKTVVYQPKPVRVVSALSLSSSLVSIPRTESTTFTLESNNSGSAASTRSHDKLEPSCQQEEDNVAGVVGSVNEGESDEGFQYFGEDHRDDDVDLVNGSDYMECQSYYLEKIYEEYFQLLTMEELVVEQEENQQHDVDSFAESLLV